MMLAVSLMRISSHSDKNTSAGIINVQLNAIFSLYKFKYKRAP